jgi:hypothetical protein
MCDVRTILRGRALSRTASTSRVKGEPPLAGQV